MPPTRQQYTSTPTEADTCRKYVVPKLQTAGWETEPHSIAEQRQFTAGRIVVAGTRATRQKAKKADYLLSYTPEMTLAVVEAKSEHKLPADGLQQAKDYAQILGLNFAYATNGKGIMEFDFLTGMEREIATFPSPDELWSRLDTAQQLTDQQTKCLLTPYNNYAGKHPRYYQEIAINRAVKSILQGKAAITGSETGANTAIFSVVYAPGQYRKGC
jgi:type I restriction enzyme R subunit